MSFIDSAQRSVAPSIGRAEGPAPFTADPPPGGGRRPLRVMHLIRTLGRGGAERNLVNVVRTLPRGEHAVCYLCPPDDYAEELRRDGIPVRRLDLGGWGDLPRVLLALGNELLRGDYQLLCTQVWLADLIGRTVGMAIGVPVISVVQTSAYEPAALALFSRGGRLKTRVFQSIDGVTSRLMLRRIVAVSQFVRSQTINRLGMPQERVAVIPNTVDPDQFRPCSDKEREESRARLGLSPQNRALLFVGKLNKGKGTDLLLSALPAVLARQPDVTLLVLGTGPEDANLRRQAEELGVSRAVRFLGQQPDVRRYLGAADLFVFASHYEGLPLAVLEAMSCGLPCLLSDIPPHREIADEGRCAVLVPQQPRAWARAILAALGNPEQAQRLARDGQLRCAEIYNVQAVAQALDRLFQIDAAPNIWQMVHRAPTMPMGMDRDRQNGPASASAGTDDPHGGQDDALTRISVKARPSVGRLSAGLGNREVRAL